ncbi:hypothetical protein [Massilimicrobiota sp. An80]|uniref:hypothetical protein n=1 Tax=Massilimicrobiota sp. An80 TaxID=1965658 RepID=UPI000B434EF0|nr:hypothetical protein [Massilimicrobiota sp. An80]OUN36500.1 hypothetical protein B5G32_07410 [Massilimicrobiota sp. An80]
MMKKFKEYRTFLFCLFLFIILMILSLYAFMQKALPQAIGCLLLSLIALLLMTTRYKIILFDNEMMIYEWKVAAMLPTLIPYQNIQSIQKKSKHHIIVEHQKTSHIYVFNSDAFLETYNEFTQEDKINENE